MNPFDVILFLPLFGALLIFLLPEGLSRKVAMAVSLATLLGFLALMGEPLANPGRYTLVTDTPWIASPAIRYHVGLDGFSVWLVFLTALLTPLALFAGQPSHRTKLYHALFLLLEFGLIGVFASLDLFLFYVLWEVVLVPAILLVGIWGGPRRREAAMRFFLYTMAASMLMLVATVFLYVKAGTFDLPALALLRSAGKFSLTGQEEMLAFLAFLLAFAAKAPLFPLHSWQPFTYEEAPTPVTVVLASVMGKMGTYGMLRIALALFPNAAKEAAPLVMTLAIISILYGASVALVQPNLKRLLAFSSLSHIGFIVLGIFAANAYGLDGAGYQMLAHGVSTGALFLLVSYMEQRTKSMELGDYGGLAAKAPLFASLLIFGSLASLGLPLLSNFVGEFLTLQGAAKVNIWYAVFASLGVVLSACYMLRMVQLVCFGEPKEPTAGRFADLSGKEVAGLAPLLVLTLWLGVYTATFLPSISAANQTLMKQTMASPVVAAQLKDLAK